MRHKIASILLFTIVLCGRPDSIAYGEVLDRIAAVVDGHIITLSDMRKEREIEAVFGDPAESDDALLKSLIDRTLLEQEMAQFPGLDVSDDEIDDWMKMKQLSDLHGVAPSEIRNAVAHLIQRSIYLTLRYRQFIVVSNEEIEKEYETTFVPEAKKRGIDVPALQGAVADGIRSNLVEEKTMHELEMSLELLRMRSSFEILQ